MSVLIDSPTRAARLARTIVSDIAIYLQSNVVLSAEARRVELDRQVEEGRRYFRSRVSAELSDQGIYDEAVGSAVLSSDELD